MIARYGRQNNCLCTGAMYIHASGSSSVAFARCAEGGYVYDNFASSHMSEVLIAPRSASPQILYIFCDFTYSIDLPGQTTTRRSHTHRSLISPEKAMVVTKSASNAGTAAGAAPSMFMQ